MSSQTTPREEIERIGIHGRCAFEIGHIEKFVDKITEAACPEIRQQLNEDWT